MGKKHSKGRRKNSRLALALVLGGLAHSAVYGADFVPLPSEAFASDAPASNPVIDLTGRVISAAGSADFNIPSAITIENVGGDISYDNEKRLFTYVGGSNPIRIRSNEGLDMEVQAMQANLQSSEATLSGATTIHQDEILIKAKDGGFYNWKNAEVDVRQVRVKIQGLLIRGSRIEYKKDEQGKEFIRIHDAYVTTEDTEKPGTWVGTGTLTIYPGDYGQVSRLSIAAGDKDVTVPVLGWFTFSHSLNPREGYMPGFGAKSHWGTYLENSYGFLLGNRRVSGGMPVADYLATIRADFRTRRGLAVGLDAENVEMSRKHPNLTGLSTYYVQDRKPMINPTDLERLDTPHERYRLALQAAWDVTPEAEDRNVDWQLATNINVLSDRYFLRDFMDELARTDDQPDNTVRLTRTSDTTQTMVYTRFAPNDFYSTDQRVEASFYRVRTALGNTGLTYETNNSAAIMRQDLPVEQYLAYKDMVDNLRDGEVKQYYQRLMNRERYFRVNTTHELTTSFKLLKFLNVTPKTGFGYTGYYDVGGVGSDNRFLGYVSCDFDLKFHRQYHNFSVSRMGLKGLTHIARPYATFSHGTISSSNKLVPQVDSWSTTLGSSTSTPMPLDLCGFTGIDGWGAWTVWRLGFQNTLVSSSDGDRLRVLNWDAFVDYNIDKPDSDNQFSNLYNIVTFRPTERLIFTLESQTPTFEGGDDFHQYTVDLTYQPWAWLETSIGYRTIEDHPVQEDSEQWYLKANIRINERYTFAARWQWDVTEKRMPIQQYSIFRNVGAWYIGATFFMRDNGGKKEEGFGISFTLGETGTALPINLF